MSSVDYEKIVVNGHYVEAAWDPKTIWGDTKKCGLFQYDNGLWGINQYEQTQKQDIIVIDGTGPYTKEWLLGRDSAWTPAFDKIEKGLAPYWTRRQCSCGAVAVYGKNCPGHSPYCALNSPTVKNNDGRDTCLKCGKPTIEQAYWNNTYNLCNNPKCEWFEK